MRALTRRFSGKKRGHRGALPAKKGDGAPVETAADEAARWMEKCLEEFNGVGGIVAFATLERRRAILLLVVVGLRSGAAVKSFAVLFLGSVGGSDKRVRNAM